MKSKTKSVGWLLLVVTIVAVNHFYPEWLGDQNDRPAKSHSSAPASSDTRTESTHSTQPSRDRGFSQLQSAVADQRGNVWFDETEFEVVKILADDLNSDKHQRFLVARDGLPTLLVAHNIDLAPRAPIKERNTVAIRGRYEWNEKGGVIHWTHDDPKGRVSGGWIRVNEMKYK